MNFPMRFHVLSLPHTQTTAAFSACAYTAKTIKFCQMMKDRGHTVFLYAGEQNEAPCDELITCIGEPERAAAVGAQHYTTASFDITRPHWRTYIANAIAGISARGQPQDFICVIAGHAQKPITDVFPHMQAVEHAVGYGGSYSPYRVFESYAWMHTCYGSRTVDPHSIDGIWYDEVIPSGFDPADFPVKVHKSDHCLYVGRMVDRKGYAIAQQTCDALGVKLYTAGPGNPGATAGASHLGVLDPVKRGEVMSTARAIFCPTLYIEPFGNVAVEAMLCGTPVISTDWGAFTETVVNGVTGFRCRSFREFKDAVQNVGKLSPLKIANYARKRYSLDAIGDKYEAYFKRLHTLYGAGWYAD